MDCKEFRNNILIFFEDNLETDDAEKFIEHVSSCKECAEELEIMYLLQVGLKKLDEEDGSESYDFRKNLQDKFAALKKRCIKVRNFENLQRAVIVTLNLATAVGIAYWAFVRFGGNTWIRNYF